jgi:hypothetical protein
VCWGFGVCVWHSGSGSMRLGDEQACGYFEVRWHHSGSVVMSSGGEAESLVRIVSCPPKSLGFSRVRAKNLLGYFTSPLLSRLALTGCTSVSTEFQVGLCGGSASDGIVGDELVIEDVS